VLAECGSSVLSSANKHPHQVLPLHKHKEQKSCEAVTFWDCSIPWNMVFFLKDMT